MSYQPPFPPGDNRPRSTPIPNETFIAPPLQEPPPPTVGAFLGNAPPQPQQPVFTPTARRRGWGCGFASLMVTVGLVVGIGAAVIAIKKAVDTTTRNAINQSNELSDPNLSNNDRNSLGLSGGELTLFEGGAPSAVAAAFDTHIAGEPTMFQQVLLYPDYAFATAQDSTQPDHFDEYIWRTANIGSPSPQQNDAEAANFVFSIDQVNWAGLSALASNAVTLTEVEEGKVTHVSIDRNTFGTNTGITIRIYVSGPRSSAFIEADANGTVTNIF